MSHIKRTNHKRPGLSVYRLEDRLTPTAPVPVGPEFQVNTYTTNLQAYTQSAIDADGDFVIVWASRNQDGDELGIFGQRYNAAGVPQGIEFQVNSITTARQHNPAVAMDADGDFVVAW